MVFFAVKFRLIRKILCPVHRVNYPCKSRCGGKHPPLSAAVRCPFADQSFLVSFVDPIPDPWPRPSWPFVVLRVSSWISFFGRCGSPAFVSGKRAGGSASAGKQAPVDQGGTRLVAGLWFWWGGVCRSRWVTDGFGIKGWECPDPIGRGAGRPGTSVPGPGRPS